MRRDPTAEQVREQWSLRDIAFLTTAVFVGHHPRYVDQQSLMRAPEGVSWEPDGEVKAERRQLPPAASTRRARGKLGPARPSKFGAH